MIMSVSVRQAPAVVLGISSSGIANSVPGNQHRQVDDAWMDPDGALNNLGIAVQEAGRFDEAITAHKDATIFRQGGEAPRRHPAREPEAAMAAQDAASEASRLQPCLGGQPTERAVRPGGHADPGRPCGVFSRQVDGEAAARCPARRGRPAARPRRDAADGSWRLRATAQVLYGVTRPLGARVEGPLTQALQHPQVALAIHADAGRPRVGEFLAAGRPHGHSLRACLPLAARTGAHGPSAGGRRSPISSATARI
jgi:hypothetical protein